MKNQKALVLLSGGLDSTVLLAKAVNDYGKNNVTALNIFYGQRHSRERACAKWQAIQKYNVDYIEEDLSKVFQFNPDSSSLLSGSTKEIVYKSYAAQISDLGGGKPVSSYVPYRNGLFLSYAAAVAIQIGCSLIFYGAHADDAAGRAYPDCTPEFINAQTSAIYWGSGQTLKMKAPWYEMNKAEIVSVGISLGVDFAHTWSCYEGGDKPCGKCGTCIDRAQAFAKNGIEDPALK